MKAATPETVRLRMFLEATVESMLRESLRVPTDASNVHILSEIGNTIAGLQTLLNTLPR